MNKKITIMILALILTISTMASIIAAASLQKEHTFEAEDTVAIPDEYSSSRYTVNESADATKELDVSKIISTVDDKKVTYITSKTISDGYSIDIYNDSEYNEYWFSDSKELVGYKYNDNPSPEEFIERKRIPDEKRPLNDKNDAVAFAEDFAKKIFGEKVVEYAVDNITDRDDSYTITRELTAGEDGFISVRRYTVRVSKYGFVESCIATIIDPDYESNISKLDSITKADLTSNATAQITEILGNASDLTVNRAFLDKDGKSVAMQVSFNTTAKVTREIHDKYGISIIEGSRYECSFIYYPLS